MSVGLHLQMIGRCLRPSEGKTHAVIIDHVGNALKHGFHTDHRQWSLDGKKKRPKDAVAIRICKTCYSANPATAKACQECGAEFEVKSVDDIATVAGTLKELAPKGMRVGDPVLANGQEGLFYIASNPEDGQVLLSRSRVGAIEIHRGTMSRERLDTSIVAPLDSLSDYVGAFKRASSGAGTLEQLQQIEKQRGYKPGWANHVYRSRLAKAGR
jgi:ribosomal protein L40E